MFHRRILEELGSPRWAEPLIGLRVLHNLEAVGVVPLKLFVEFLVE